jgi:hypothetical protein
VWAAALLSCGPSRANEPEERNPPDAGTVTHVDDDAGVRPAFSRPCAWQPLAPNTHATSGWYGHTAVLEPRDRRLVVFGGRDHIHHPDEVTDQLLALSLSAPSGWESVRAVPAGPAPREGHAAVLEGKRMIVFGGRSGDDPAVSLDDTWTLELSGVPLWTRLAAGGQGPPGRSGHSLVLDRGGGRLILFGGTGGEVPLNDVWVLSTGPEPTWAQLVPGGTPPEPRSLHAAVFDPSGNRMIVFGGRGQSGVEVGDAWELVLGSEAVWNQLWPAGVSPAARAGHSAAYDAARRRMIVHGGAPVADGDELWALSLSDEPAWERITTPPARPGPRVSSAVVVDENARQMVVAGGLNDRGSHADAWVLQLDDAPAWTDLTRSPGDRESSVATLDPTSGQVLMFGGTLQFGAPPVSDLWSLSPEAAPRFAQLVAATSTPWHLPRSKAAFDASRQRLAIYSPPTSSQPDSLWRVDLSESPTWIAIRPAGTPPGEAFAAAFDPLEDRLAVVDAEGLSMTSLDPASSEWVRRGARFPFPLSVASGAYDAAGRQFWIWGCAYDCFVFRVSLSGQQQCLGHVARLLPLIYPSLIAAKRSGAGSRVRWLARSTGARKRPVWLRPTWAIASGVPSATISPPRSPASGPRSITRSATLITSRLCSMTTTAFP